MSESARKKQRTTPRNSEAASDNNDSTIYNALQQLANVIPKPITPFQRHSSAGPTPGSRRTPNIRTPGTAARTPRGGPATRPLPSRRAAPTTPHAIRALRERANAARTPGRRRSGRVQRETPRDILRALSRTLARDTAPIEPSPDAEDQPARRSALDLPDIEDGDDPAVPRLSMPLDDMYEDDSFHEAPPRRSLLPDLPDDVDGGTMHSLEFGRRALSEDPRAMFSRRASERFADLQELGIDASEYDIDGPLFNRRPLDADQLLQNAIEDALEDTGEIRALTGRRDGRPSDVDLGVFGEMDEPDEPTFRFTVPQRIRQPPVQVEPTEDDAPLPIEDDDVGAGAEAEADLDLDAEGSEEEGVTGYGAPEWESDAEIEGEADADLQAYRGEESAIDRSLLQRSPDQASVKGRKPRTQNRELKISAAGIEYPSFSAAVVKRLATGLAKSQGANAKISKDTLAALVQTTDWFFEDVSLDLAAYAQHAGRKSIEDADVIALMKRQRNITNNATAFSLAQKMLPRELMQELRMQPLGKLKRGKRKRMETVREEEEED